MTFLSFYIVDLIRSEFLSWYCNLTRVIPYIEQPSSLPSVGHLATIDGIDMSLVLVLSERPGKV